MTVVLGAVGVVLIVGACVLAVALCVSAARGDAQARAAQDERLARARLYTERPDSDGWGL